MTESIGILSVAKIKNMLKLEQLFHNKYLSVELLHELISLYTCSIESMDEAQSELRYYFIEKIQFVLSRPESQALLDINSPNLIQNALRETLRATARVSIPEPDMKKHQKKLINYDGEHPDEKKKKIDMQLTIMEQTQQNMSEMSSEVSKMDERKRKEKERIISIEKDQDDQLQVRLAKRKKGKPRKKSMEAKAGEGQSQMIKKEDLIKAQEEIHDAIIRITLRNTMRKYEEDNLIEGKKEKQRQSTKGRVKKLSQWDDD